MPKISIHAPAWGATYRAREQKDILRISIPPPGGGATAAPEELHARRPISIHAPAWGATGACDE